MKKLFTSELATIIAIMSVASMAMAVLQPVMPLFLTSIGVLPSLIGLMLSVAMVGMVGGESTGGWIADHIGIKTPLAVGTFVCIPLVLSFVYARGTTVLFVIFLFWGIVRSTIFGPGRGYVNNAATVASRATLIAVLMTAQSLTRSLGTFAGGFVADHWGYESDFYVSAGISLLAGVLVIVGLRRSSFPRVLLRGPSARVSQARSEGAPPVMSDGIAGRPETAVKYRPFIWQCAVTALFVLGGGINSFMPLLATQIIGVDATGVGLVYTISSLVSVAALIPLGRLSDRKGRKKLMLAALILSALAFAGLAFARNWTLLIILEALCALNFALFTPAAVALISNTVPEHWQGTAMGIYGAAEDIGIIAGLALGGYAWAAWGPLAFLIIGGSSSLIGAAVCLGFVSDTRGVPLAKPTN